MSQSFPERAYWGIRRRVRSLFNIDERVQQKWARIAKERREEQFRGGFATGQLPGFDNVVTVQMPAGFGRYSFYDCGAYGLFTLATERFQPKFVGSPSTRYSEFFTSPRTPIIPAETQVWQEVGAPLTALGSSVTVLDVGGYIGTFCIPLALCAKASGIDAKIHSFEPGPTEELVKINVKANGLQDTITTHSVALSDYDGHTIYRYSEGGSIGGNVFADRTDTSLERIVQSGTIDSFCRGISGPLFIKLDTQGHEPKIMMRAAKVISEKRAVWRIEFLAWSARQDMGGETFADMLLREFHVFSGGEQITERRMPSFIEEIDKRKWRMADLTLVPKDAPFTERVLAAL